MSVLDNITISDAVLESFKPDVSSLLFDGQDDFSAVITRVKEEVYGQIKIREKEENYYSYTDSEVDTALESVRDFDNEKYLQKRIACRVIAELFRAHNDIDSAVAWDSRAEKIPFRYYVDSDADFTPDDSENRNQATFQFGR